MVQVHRYEQWLVQQDGAINNQLKYYETEIGKLRKMRKVTVDFILKKNFFVGGDEEDIFKL